MKTAELRLKYLSHWRSMRNKARGGILCPYCNFYAISLGGHMFYAHNITAFEFRKDSGYTQPHQLTAEDYHQNRVELGKKNSKLFNLPEKGMAALRKKGFNRGLKLDIRDEHRENAKKRYSQSLAMQKGLEHGRRPEAHKGKWSRHKHPQLGKPLALTTKEKVSASLKKYYEQHPEEKIRCREQLRPFWGKYKDGSKRLPTLSTCIICGKEFKIRPCRLRKGIGKTCSRSCSAKYTILRFGNPFKGKHHTIETKLIMAKKKRELVAQGWKPYNCKAEKKIK